MQKQKPNFWERKPLADLTKKEWESLCDGCGRCCLNKLEDEDTGEIFFTDVACKLLDLETCRCGNYRHRLKHVPDCQVLGLDHPEYFNALPNSCAYRRLYEGKSLPDWHPLLTGDPNSVHQAGISVCGMCISEEHVHADDLEDRIIEFHD